MIKERGKESLKTFTQHVNMCHPAIKLTAEYSTVEVNFLGANMNLTDVDLKTNFFVNLPTGISFQIQLVNTLTTAKIEYLKVKL